MHASSVIFTLRRTIFLPKTSSAQLHNNKRYLDEDVEEDGRTFVATGTRGYDERRWWRRQRETNLFGCDGDERQVKREEDRRNMNNKTATSWWWQRPRREMKTSEQRWQQPVIVVILRGQCYGQSHLWWGLNNNKKSKNNNCYGWEIQLLNNTWWEIQHSKKSGEDFQSYQLIVRIAGKSHQDNDNFRQVGVMRCGRVWGLKNDTFINFS